VAIVVQLKAAIALGDGLEAVHAFDVPVAGRGLNAIPHKLLRAVERR
jgi:hypothetical protein